MTNREVEEPLEKANVNKLDQDIRRAKQRRTTATPELKQLKRDRQRTVAKMKQLENDNTFGPLGQNDLQLERLRQAKYSIDQARRNTSSWKEDTAKIHKMEEALSLIPKEERYKQRREHKKKVKVHAKQHRVDLENQVKKLRQLRRENKIFVSFDMERWVENPKKTLEIGIAKFQSGEISVQHYIVEENIEFRNERFVPDNREKFAFGTSQMKAESDILIILELEIERADFVVGHALNTDWEYLPERIHLISENKILDAQDFYRCLKRKNQKSNIEKSCIEMNIPIDAKCLHNAGNDAYYTIAYFMKLIEEPDIIGPKVSGNNP